MREAGLARLARRPDYGLEKLPDCRIRVAGLEPIYRRLPSYGKRRVGRPRGHWAETTMENALNKHNGMQFDSEDTNHHVFVFCLAIDRLI